MTRVVALFLTAMTGFSGLVYEIVWQKYLATLLGSHSEATAAVLAIFLGGLSIGYWLFGTITSRLVATARQSPVIVLTRRSRGRRVAELRDRGVTVVSHPGAGRGVPLAWGLGALLAGGVSSLMVEGGSELLGSFAAEGRFDQLALFTAPLLLAGRRSCGGHQLGGA